MQPAHHPPDFESVLRTAQPEQAARAARKHFEAVHGMSVTGIAGGESFHAARDGLPIKRGHALQLVSEAAISVREGEVHVKAAFGNVRRLRNFLIIFLFFLAVILACTGLLVHSLAMAGWMLAPLLPWVVLIPLLTAVYRMRAQRAAETLVTEMAKASDASPPMWPDAPISWLAPGPYYAICVLLIVAAGVLLAGSLVYSTGSVSRGGMAAPVPGETTLLFPEKGRYTVFHEWRGEAGGATYESERDLRGFDFRLWRETTAQPVPFDWQAGQGSRYRFPSRAGYSIGRVTIPEPGPYVLNVAHSEGALAPHSQLRFLPALNRWLVLGILPAAGVVALVSGIALIAFRAETERQQLPGSDS